MKSKIGIKSYKNENEHKVDEKLIDLFNNCPIPQNQILENLGLFLNAKNFSRILFMHHIYDKIKNIQGVIMDFGTRWGNNMALFSIFRGMYEPFNRHRKIIGFDTFSGFPSINKKDGKSDLMEEGNVATTKKYEVYLNQIMSVQEQQNPISHIKKYEICKGDASEKLKDYIDNNPETIIALGELAFITFSYRGRVFFPLEMNGWVKMAFASEILRRVEISSGAKLSAIETTTHPALIMPR